jgi:hypothetical protein
LPTLGAGVAAELRAPLGGGKDDPRLEEAAEFREAFHWGNPARRVVARRASKPPEVAVKLGKLHSVTYETTKRGERARLFEHAFEGHRPDLAMDIDNRRLHLVGGSYTVTADGIAG